MLIGYLVQGAALGLSATATPGPLQAFLISRAVQYGWKRTLPATLAPLLSDGPIVVLVLLVLTRLPAEFIRFLRIAGGGYVIFLAWRTFLAFRSFQTHPPPPQASQQTLLQAIGINLLNPNPYIFWSLAAGPIVLQGLAIQPALAFGFITGFYGIFILSSMLLVVLFSTARSLGPKAVRAMLGISALALLAFGLYQIMQGFGAA
jgi:threonine/homoserine/homoserine lactone efflux protein